MYVKRVALVLISMLVILILLTGCGNNGNVYIGKWIKSDPNPANNFVEIKKNGDSFILTYTQNMPSIGTLNVATNQYPATLKDKNILSIQSGFGPLDISYVKDDNTILFDGAKWNKMTPEMEQKYNQSQEKIKAEIEKNAPKKNPLKDRDRGLL